MPIRTPRHALVASLAFHGSLLASACIGESEPANSPANEVEISAAGSAQALSPDAPEARAATARANGEAPTSGPASGGESADVPAARRCRELMHRSRDCSAAFIPALVAERVRLDLPAGIAAYDAKIGREALVSEALDEYAEDSKDERIASTCAELAQRLPPERGQRLVDTGRECLALDDCDRFVACAVPISVQP